MAGQFHLEQPPFDRALNGRTLLAASNADTELTAAQSIHSVVTMTPTTGRAVTTATGPAIIAELGEYRVGSTFEVTVVNLAGATHAITFTANATGVTVTGSGTVAAASSATFIGRVATSSTVIYYRK
jgi:hypothetical protein